MQPRRIPRAPGAPRERERIKTTRHEQEIGFRSEMFYNPIPGSDLSMFFLSRRRKVGIIARAIDDEKSHYSHRRHGQTLPANLVSNNENSRKRISFEARLEREREGEKEKRIGCVG